MTCDKLTHATSHAFLFVFLPVHCHEPRSQDYEHDDHAHDRDDDEVDGRLLVDLVHVHVDQLAGDPDAVTGLHESIYGMRLR